MKTRFIWVAMLAALFFPALKAQYHFTYFGGASDDVKLTGSTTTTALTRGAISVGVGGNTLHVTYADPTLAVVYFNKYYNLNVPSMPNALITSAQVMEGNASTIVVIGTYKQTAPLQEGLFFLTLSPTGTVGVSSRYLWTTAGTSDLLVNGITTDGTYFYVAGKAKVTVGGVGQTYPLAVKYDIAGNVQWGSIYQVSSPGSGFNVWGTDIEYMPPPSGPKVYMVGFYYDNAAAFAEGFLLPMDPVTGLPGLALRYGDMGNTRNESFSGICLSTAAAGHNLMLTGSSNARGAGTDYDAWLVKVDPNGLVINTPMLYDYAHVPNAHNYSADVMERYSTIWGYTYYLTGFASGGLYGGEDIHVLKLQTNGVPFTLGDNTYGTIRDERGEMSWQDNGTPDPGLQIFGHGIRTAADRDFINIHAFYNGVSCNGTQRDGLYYSGPGRRGEHHSTQINSLQRYDILNTNVNSSFKNLCNKKAGDLPAGHNSKAADGEAPIEMPAISISSNITARGLAAVQIMATEPVAAHVEVMDLRGVVLFSGNMDLSAGVNLLPESSQVAAGIVVVRVTTVDGRSFAGKVLIQ